jgi:hypothetical protein
VLIAPVSKQIPWYQGILQGILRFWGLRTRFSARKPPALQPLLEQFPTQIISENILKNSEILSGISDLYPKDSMNRRRRMTQFMRAPNELSC